MSPILSWTSCVKEPNLFNSISKWSILCLMVLLQLLFHLLHPVDFLWHESKYNLGQIWSLLQPLDVFHYSVQSYLQIFLCTLLMCSLMHWVLKLQKPNLKYSQTFDIILRLRWFSSLTKVTLVKNSCLALKTSIAESSSESAPFNGSKERNILGTAPFKMDL